MNIRAALHALATGLSLVAVGTVVFSGLPVDVMQAVASACLIANVIIETYLGSTSSGVNKAG